MLLSIKIVSVETLYKEHISSKTFVKINLLKSQNKAKVNVQLHWTSLFQKSSWIEIIASRLYSELGEHGEKKLMETGILSIKMNIAHFTLLTWKF